MTRAFLDASVLVAAVASTGGGSALLLELCRRERLELVVSRLVLLEAERNIRKKLPPSALKRYHGLLEGIRFLIVPAPSEAEVRSYRAWIHEKDAPVLAAAAASRCACLITLDRRHFMTERMSQAGFPFRIFTPREFFRFSL